jgi:excisionase family DNA binding protein
MVRPGQSVTIRSRIGRWTDVVEELTLDDLKDGVFYTIKQVAQMLALCANSVRNAIREGELPAYRTKGDRLDRLDDLGEGVLGLPGGVGLEELLEMQEQAG